jgi:hypothetical protein
VFTPTYFENIKIQAQIWHIWAVMGSTAKVTIELKKKGSRGKLPFGEKGVKHENPTGIVLGKGGDIPL